MKLHKDGITTANELAELANKLRSETLIGIDTEFIREKTFFPELEVIQIATLHEAWWIDIGTLRRKIKDRNELYTLFLPLLDVLTEEGILKIVHAAHGDQEVFFSTFGITCKPIFDTAIGASLLGYGEAAGLARLLSGFLSVEIKKGQA